MIYDQTLQEPDPVVGFSGTGLNGYVELVWSPPVDLEETKCRYCGVYSNPFHFGRTF